MGNSEDATAAEGTQPPVQPSMDHDAVPQMDHDAVPAMDHDAEPAMDHDDDGS